MFFSHSGPGVGWWQSVELLCSTFVFFLLYILCHKLVFFIVLSTCELSCFHGNMTHVYAAVVLYSCDGEFLDAGFNSVLAQCHL